LVEWDCFVVPPRNDGASGVDWLRYLSNDGNYLNGFVVYDWNYFYTFAWYETFV
jgi:hypothetical protein